MHPRDPLLGNPGHFQIETGGVDQLRLEHVSEVAGDAVEITDRVVEDLDRVGASVETEQRPAELEADPRAPDRVLDLPQGLLQVGRSCGDVDSALGKTQLRERLDAVALLRRFLERPPQIGDRRVRCTPGEGARGGLAQRCDDEPVPARRHQLEMPGGTLRCSAGSDDPLRRASVREHTFGGVDRLVHGRAHDGVGELDVRHQHTQQVLARQHGRGMAGDLELELRQLRDLPELRAVAEHRRRAREPLCLSGQPGQTQRDRPRHRLRPNLEHAVGVRRHRLQRLGCNGVEQCPQEEGVATGRHQTGLRKGTVGAASELLRGELNHRLDPQRSRSDQHGRRVGDELGQELRLLALLGRPHADDNRQRQALEPAGEVREPA